MPKPVPKSGPLSTERRLRALEREIQLQQVIIKGLCERVFGDNCPGCGGDMGDDDTEHVCGEAK